MGVHKEDFLIIGYKLPYDITDWHNEPYNQYKIKGSDYSGFNIIGDGMCGEYAYFGKIIASLNEDDDDWDDVEMSLAKTDAIMQEVRDEFVKIFEGKISLNEHIPKIILFTHYT
jgi:hypothetical protein